MGFGFDWDVFEEQPVVQILGGLDAEKSEDPAERAPRRPIPLCHPPRFDRTHLTPIAKHRVGPLWRFG